MVIGKYGKWTSICRTNVLSQKRERRRYLNIIVYIILSMPRKCGCVQTKVCRSSLQPLKFPQPHSLDLVGCGNQPPSLGKQCIDKIK